MKAILSLELFGEDTREYLKLYTGIMNMMIPGLGKSVIGGNPPSSWVAEITGFDKKYKYSRQFIKRKIDYANSNSKGSRGLIAEFLLESGKIYDVKSQVSWNRSERYFCTVDNEGEIHKILEEEVNECLRSRLEWTYLKPQSNE